MPTPACGQIIFATVFDPQGRNPKARPLVILTSNADIARGEPLVVAAISTSYKQLRAAHYVCLPWHHRGNSRTKLKADCAVVCNWLEEIDRGDIVGYGGVVPPDKLDKVFEKVDKLNP